MSHQSIILAALIGLKFGDVCLSEFMEGKYIAKFCWDAHVCEWTNAPFHVLVWIIRPGVWPFKVPKTHRHLLVAAPGIATCEFHMLLNRVSAPDVTSTDRWLNIWCIWHTYLETLQEIRSRLWIRWIIQDFRQTCVSRSLTFSLETKMPRCQILSRKKKAVVFTTDDERLSGSTKFLNWIFKSMWQMQSLRHRIFEICQRVLHSGLLLWRHFHAPKHDMKQNETWLVALPVSHMASWGRALAIQSRQSSQTFSRQFSLRETTIQTTNRTFKRWDSYQTVQMVCVSV